MPKKHLYLSEESLKIAEEFKKENNLPSTSKAIDEIIKEHKNRNTNEIKNVPEYMAKIIAEELKDEFKNIRSIKSATNSVNKDTQVILHLLNGIYYKEDYGVVPDLDFMPQKAYKFALEKVESKIKKEQYKKSNNLD